MVRHESAKLWSPSSNLGGASKNQKSQKWLYRAVCGAFLFSWKTQKITIFTHFWPSFEPKSQFLGKKTRVKKTSMFENRWYINDYEPSKGRKKGGKSSDFFPISAVFAPVLFGFLKRFTALLRLFPTSEKVYFKYLFRLFVLFQSDIYNRLPSWLIFKVFCAV